MKNNTSPAKVALILSSTSNGCDSHLGFNKASIVLFWGIFMKTTFFAGLIAGVALSSPASAAQVFFQDFETVTPSLSLTSLPGFTVTGQTVDVVGAVNTYGINALSNVVDLDGTPGPATITSANTFAFNAGDRVTLSFLVGGAQRGSPSDDFILGWTLSALIPVSNVLGTGYFNYINIANAFGSTSGSTSISLPGQAAFTLSTVAFTAGAAGSLGFSFGTTSFDTIGPLLDNVGLDISAVPGPMMGAGIPGLVIALGALVALRRRRILAA